MKTNEQIEKAFIEAVGNPEKATEETVIQSCKAVLEKASSLFGPGIYVSGKLNVDMQGISFTYKRPSIRQRLQVFVPVPVDKPARKEDVNEMSQKADDDQDSDNPTADDDPIDTGSTKDSAPDDRLLILEEAASKLTEEQFTVDGRPEVAPVNALLDEGVKAFTAKERDKLWATRSGE